MEPSQWKKIKELLVTALEINPEHWREFLDGVLDSEIRQEVKALLEVDISTMDFIDQPLYRLDSNTFNWPRHIIARPLVKQED